MNCAQFKVIDIGNLRGEGAVIESSIECPLVGTYLRKDHNYKIFMAMPSTFNSRLSRGSL